MATDRRIVHVDMDAFYASVEQRDDPSLRGKPVVVGGDPQKRGAVAAASYEARRFGIRSAMPTRKAFRLCPEAVFLRPRFDAYREAAATIRAILERYADRLEPVALDEAYLDPSDRAEDLAAAVAIAAEIRQTIRAELDLPASAGISFNKFLAKMASGRAKPDGLFAISPEEAEGFVAALPVEKMHGIGPATAAKLYEMGIRNGADLRVADAEALVARFGKRGLWFAAIARGEDNRPVETHRERRSVSVETTFEQDTRDRAVVVATLDRLAAKLVERLAGRWAGGRTVVLKLRFGDYRLLTRSRTGEAVFSDAEAIARLAETMLDRCWTDRRPVRLVGVGLTKLVPPSAIAPGQQLTLAL